jgi:hypothetical protein
MYTLLIAQNHEPIAGLYSIRAIFFDKIENEEKRYQCTAL